MKNICKNLSVLVYKWQWHDFVAVCIAKYEGILICKLSFLDMGGSYIINKVDIERVLISLLFLVYGSITSATSIRVIWFGHLFPRRAWS